VHIHMNEDDIVYHANENNLNGSVDDDDDDDEENNNCNNSNYIKSTSKMIQCQQISMYIGEKKILLIIFLLLFLVSPPSSYFDFFHSCFWRIFIHWYQYGYVFTLGWSLWHSGIPFMGWEFLLKAFVAIVQKSVNFGAVNESINYFF